MDTFEIKAGIKRKWDSGGELVLDAFINQSTQKMIEQTVTLPLQDRCT